jgi:hypothetical protein
MSEAADRDTRLAALEARLVELEDREAIRNLVAGYGPLADGGDATAVAAMWRQDGVYSVGGFGENRGRDAIAALITAPHHRQMMAQGCAHVLSPLHIELHGTRAIAVGYSCVFLHRESRFEVHRVSSNRWELAKGTAGWQVVRRTNRLLDGDEAARHLLSPG